MKNLLRNSFTLLSTLIFLLFLWACGGNNNKAQLEIDYNNKIAIYAPAEPNSLNPVNYNEAISEEINHFLFQKLLDVDHRTAELAPVLAESRPTLTQTPEGFLQVAYKINPKASWDDGTSITAKDVEFSLKTVLCPGVNNEANKANFILIKDFKYSDEDPLAFTIVYKEKYIRAEFNSGAEYFILPKTVFDSSNALTNYHLIDFIDSTRLAKVANDIKIKKWAEEFNSVKFSRNPNYLIGSGPYKIQNWTTTQEIRLTKKNNWWGSNSGKHTSYLESNIDQIIYKVITDQTTALTALKSGQLDAMSSIKAKDFKSLNDNPKIANQFYLSSNPSLGYSYLGVNTKNPILSNKNTRQALAYLIDVENIIKTINYGYATRIAGPTHPAKKESYDFNLTPYLFDVNKAKELLALDGWKDTDNNGILDKQIQGKKTELRISLLVNSGSDERSAIAVLLKDWFAKAGIELEILTREWGTFIQAVVQKKFDLYYGAWNGEFAPDDHTQVFHTQQINGGSNFTSFGNKQTDALIDSIKIELNETKRNEMYKRFQRIIYTDGSYLFLISANNNTAVSKKFDNVYFSSVHPGFWAAGFKLKANNKK